MDPATAAEQTAPAMNPGAKRVIENDDRPPDTMKTPNTSIITMMKYLKMPSAFGVAAILQMGIQTISA